MSSISNHGPGGASIGAHLNHTLDALGLPDKFGDMMGAMVDKQVSRIGQTMQNLTDLASQLKGSALAQVTGAGKGSAAGRGFVHRHRCGGAHLRRHQQSYLRQDQIGQKAHIGMKYGCNWGPFKLTGQITGQQYLGSFAKPLQLPNDKLMYQGRIYENLGDIWRDLRDGKIDGLATQRSTIPAFNALPLLPNFPGIGGGSGNPPSAGGSPSTGDAGGTGGTGGTDSTGDIMSGAGSLEDKLLLLMDKLAKHLDKQIEDQMKKIEAEMAKQKQGSEGASKSGGGGGLFGKLLGAAGSALGGPIGGMAGSMLGGLMGGSGQSSGGSGEAGGSGGSQNSNLQLMQAQLQQMIERRNQMFQTMTQMLKSLNDTSLSIIRNLKA